MWFALVGIVAVWLVVATVVALLLGRAVHVADRRRPRAPRLRSRAAAAIGRVVTLATGSIPVIGPRIVEAVTGAVPVVRG